MDDVKISIQQLLPMGMIAGPCDIHMHCLIGTLTQFPVQWFELGTGTCWQAEDGTVFRLIENVTFSLN